MNHRPRSITVIGWSFIAIGCFGIVAHTLSAIRSSESPLDLALAVSSGLLAIVGGVTALRGINGGRWLLVVWMGAHIVISSAHSWSDVLVHAVLFSVVSIVLFRSRASEYFRGIP